MDGEEVAERHGFSETDMVGVRERLARAEATVTSVAADTISLRERVHSLANETQRILGELSSMSKIVERLVNSMEAQTKQSSASNVELATHVTGCRTDNAAARDERLAFRREMRRYMMAILSVIVGYFIAGKLHITLDGVMP